MYSFVLAWPLVFLVGQRFWTECFRFAVMNIITGWPRGARGSAKTK